MSCLICRQPVNPTPFLSIVLLSWEIIFFFQQCRTKSRSTPSRICTVILRSLIQTTPDRRQSKILLTIDERESKIAKTGDKWQSKTLFLNVFDLRTSIALTFSNAAYPLCKHLRGFANTKCADQPTYLRSLISAFVISLLEIVHVSYLNLLQAKFQFSS